MKIFIIDMYLTSLIKSWIRSGKEKEIVLKILNDISNISNYLLERVNFYSQVISSCHGDKDKLQSIILYRDVNNHDGDNDSKNNLELEDGGLGLSEETVNELCGVFGSLACVYLRSVHSVFRNG
ncbi:hypothetical protein C6P40_002353 [Pichia californica]|uniref:Uncharacterized protein n=1 Tax=Pichia californica TaxID=460514 RepID=A0A9P6WHW1_9ASCO|nr:hypothetical protein C6P40_002353 [[Candida] californica]